jgi:DNA polymerase I-like protein with 3'-5' exonuclease and polymerase domains
MALIKVLNDNPFGEDLKIVLTVHDEIVLEVVKELAKEAEEFLIKCMLEVEQQFLVNIEAAVETTVGPCWSK